MSALSLYGQSEEDKEQAYKLAKEAIRLMDEEGNFDKSIELLEKSKKLDPNNLTYSYEIAYAHYNLKDYKKAIKILEKLKNRKDVTEVVFQLLGNSYDILGDPEKAIETYSNGLKIFENSGSLYLELGIVNFFKENYNEAIQCWENGIIVEPEFPSNYYWLAKIFSNTNEKIWALFYGEIFMNLERGSKRTEEISNKLFSVFQECYISKSDTSGEFQLTEKGFQITINSKKDLKNIAKGKDFLPFEGVFASDFAIAGAFAYEDGTTSINEIFNIRSSIINLWFNEKKHCKNFSNILMDYQKTIYDKGYLEPYTYWLLMKGNEKEFEDWYNKNEENFKLFITWYQNNPLRITKKDKYARIQY